MKKELLKKLVQAEAALVLKLNKNDFEIIKGIDLSELCITSSVEIIAKDSDVTIAETSKAKGIKCPVCWKISEKPCIRHG